MASTGDGMNQGQGVGQTAQAAMGQVQDKAQQVAGQAKGYLRTQLDQRSTAFGNQLSSTAEDIRSVSDQLRDKGRDSAAGLIEGLADRTNRLGDYLKDADGNRILRDLESLARKQPWAVAGAGLVLGLAASRFMKASSTQRYQSSSGRSYGGVRYGHEYEDYGAGDSGYIGSTRYGAGASYEDDTERYSE
ncbi:MAG: hypothetical protein GIW99_01735 [Candidatus Eremiobacteraeota bacterium]|nr:hypothetical protein [Candidatus Eremiobacteraeota bacterium]MBC5826398.1 hypothetical protein [Candidatus Eremiobacteraeota bacterium]